MNLEVLPNSILLTAPTGDSQLPKVEIPRSKLTRMGHVRLSGKKRQESDCSFGSFDDSHLAFSAWNFFHAAKKTELSSSHVIEDSTRKAMCFAEEHRNLFVWNTDNLRRIDHSLFSLEDFSERALAGRFGEAIAYLVMINAGYKYFDRVATLWERRISGLDINHPEKVKLARIVIRKVSKRPHLEPDFAFEKADGFVALSEAKGSFVNASKDNPSVAGDLRHALKQLDAWSKLILPTPRKCIGIGTYFRDVSDDSGDPTLIAYVDPEGKEPDRAAVNFPEDWIRRGNYGAWLIGMGFERSGKALREGKKSNIEASLQPILEVTGKKYLVSFLHIKAQFNLDILKDGQWPLYIEEIILFSKRHTNLRIKLMGIGLDTIKLIEDVFREGTSARGRNDDSLPEKIVTSEEFFYGSIFPDGTLYGEIGRKALETITFRTTYL